MLRRLDLPDSNVLMWDELEKWPTEERDRFIRLGLLREIEPARQILLTECDREPLAEPIWRTNPMTGKLEGVYGCGDDECAGIHFIDPQRMPQWEFSFEALALAIAGAIGASGRPSVDVRDYSCFLGSVIGTGGARDVFLTRGLWWKDAPAVLADGSRLAASSNVTLLCVRRMPPMEQRPASWRKRTSTCWRH